MIVQKEGKRTITRSIPYYNLDIILAVGYGTTSKIATEFRKWATKILHKYIVDGYIINESKLKKQTEKIILLQQTVDLLNRSLVNQAEKH